MTPALWACLVVAGLAAVGSVAVGVPVLRRRDREERDAIVAADVRAAALPPPYLALLAAADQADVALSRPDARMLELELRSAGWEIVPDWKVRTDDEVRHSIL